MSGHAVSNYRNTDADRAKAMNRPHVQGDGWTAWVDPRIHEWVFRGDDRKMLRMLAEEFDRERILQYYATSVEMGRAYGLLYDDVVAFFARWGVKVAAVNLPPLYPETPPS